MQLNPSPCGTGLGTSTLSLHVAVRGWPMVRFGNSRWLAGDCGGPETLATQIAFWESPVSELGDWHDHIKELNKQQGSRD
ncbi:hypothetical protein [Endozoicomonas euniceicola]|uniref:Uncharacterized protein n=1 Tax=Endozoicomonas euniceicola TaxID=1234143 RepID=A0ABY6GUA7_9GAMM|nr:hypothetical protein [Endozoicomonas euniceicola]UYM16358.1 hypothetical protein NX720_26800 [Endozoicomonas euniceicola]